MTGFEDSDCGAELGIWILDIRTVRMTVAIRLGRWANIIKVNVNFLAFILRRQHYFCGMEVKLQDTFRKQDQDLLATCLTIHAFLGQIRRY